MNNKVNEKEIKELNDKFVAFLHTKGISKQYKLSYKTLINYSIINIV